MIWTWFSIHFLDSLDVNCDGRQRQLIIICINLMKTLILSLSIFKYIGNARLHLLTFIIISCLSKRTNNRTTWWKKKKRESKVWIFFILFYLKVGEGGPNMTLYINVK